MGGTKDPKIHSPANIIFLCGSGTTGCHGWIEGNRTAAYHLGLLVYRADDPATIPVSLMRGHGLLLDDGGWQPC